MLRGLFRLKKHSQPLRSSRGFRVELVAAEPLLHDPVQIAFAADGSIWVLEMGGYMPNADGTEELQPVGRVLRLRDVDGDGRMDEREVFLDKLILPRAIAPARDGLLVVEPQTWSCAVIPMAMDDRIPGAYSFPVLAGLKVRSTQATAFVTARTTGTKHHSTRWRFAFVARRLKLGAAERTGNGV